MGFEKISKPEDDGFEDFPPTAKSEIPADLEIHTHETPDIPIIPPQMGETLEKLQREDEELKAHAKKVPQVSEIAEQKDRKGPTMH